MFDKKFGLDEARSLAGAGPEVSLPTVKATLKVLGVANVVGRQVAKIVAGADAAIKAAGESRARIQAEDETDEKRTAAELAEMQARRKNRAGENAFALSLRSSEIANLQAEIGRLQELAKKFS